MSILSKLFGGGGGKSAAAEPVAHEGFRIYPEPQNEGGQYRLQARIEKDVGGELRSHHLIRADVFTSADDAAEAAVAKAKMLIDQLGDGLFN